MAVIDKDMSLAADENRKSGDRLSSASQPTFDGKERIDFHEKSLSNKVHYCSHLPSVFRHWSDASVGAIRRQFERTNHRFAGGGRVRRDHNALCASHELARDDRD
jgi:hypothetical protein